MATEQGSIVDLRPVNVKYTTDFDLSMKKECVPLILFYIDIVEFLNILS